MQNSGDTSLNKIEYAVTKFRTNRLLVIIYLSSKGISLIEIILGKTADSREYGEIAQFNSTW